MPDPRPAVRACVRRDGKIVDFTGVWHHLVFEGVSGRSAACGQRFTLDGSDRLPQLPALAAAAGAACKRCWR